MKALRTIYLSIFLGILPVICTAQDRAADAIFNRHSGETGYTSVTYGTKMLKMMKKDASKELSELLDGIKTIRIISCKTKGSLNDEAKRIAGRFGYELVSEVGDNGRYTSFFFKDEGKGLSSFLMASSGKEGDAVLDIFGKFDIRDISTLSVIGTDRQ